MAGRSRVFGMVCPAARPLLCTMYTRADLCYITCRCTAHHLLLRARLFSHYSPLADGAVTGIPSGASRGRKERP